MHHRVNVPARLALVAAAALTLSSAAQAAPAESESESESEAALGLVDLGEDGEIAEPEATDPATQRPWIHRYGPRRNMWEVGIFGGLWLPADNIELRDRNLAPVRYDLSAQLGLRAGYYPLRHLGLEGELAMIPTRIQSEQRAFVSTARAQLVVQLGLWRVVPFAVLGGGVLSVRSEPDAAGRNGDEALHVGGGLKLFLTEHILLRVEGRDVMSPREGRTPVSPAHSGELLLGFSLALGPRKQAEPPPPPDADGDGVLDPDDACPEAAGIAPDGCPAIDGDSDGFLDREDACPQQPGAAPDGCPIPDGDGDGFLDPDDACPDELGIEPDGCPLRDVDGDGMLPPQDTCPDQPETVNGFEDTDGCPDQIPAAVQRFTGVIEGIEFATGKAIIRKKSFPTIDQAIVVLAEYPDLRVEVSGHTDSRGKHDPNVELSHARADSVKAYMVSQGIDAARIETRGAGPDEPIGDNKTKAGRQENRRIEFKLLTASPTPAESPSGPAVDAPPEPAPSPSDADSAPPPDDAGSAP